jgi:peptidoglycan hydrolase CwlO-like protein
MEHIWEIVGYLATAFAGTFFGWLFGRKKYNAEVEGTRVQNFDAAIEAYKKMYEDMISDLKEQNGELKEEVDSLKQELSENRKQIITLTNFVLASAIQRGENTNNFEDLKEIIK